jgi:hypothetical protein
MAVVTQAIAKSKFASSLTSGATRLRNVATATWSMPLHLLALTMHCAPLKADQKLPPADAGVDEKPAGDSGPDHDARDAVPSDALMTDADSSATTPDAEGCVTTCNAVGSFSCKSSDQAMACTSFEGCARWIDLPKCPAGSMCCDGSCVEQRCGCGDAGCTTDADADTPETDICSETGSCLRVDYYVDAAATAAGDGSPQAPFKTITAALDAIQVTGVVNARIHVSSGTYNGALGERLPLVLRGVSLMGAGREQTIIEGLGDWNPSPAMGSLGMGMSYPTTLVVGDAARPTLVSNLGVRNPTFQESSVGIWCDRGNDLGASDLPEGGPPPEPSTTLDAIGIGPGLAAGIVTTNSRVPSRSGCNLKLTSSRLVGAWSGIWAPGCGTNEPAQVQVGLLIGGETPGTGNTFSQIRNSTADAAGLALGPCVAYGIVQNNVFVDSNAGIMLDQPGELSDGGKEIAAPGRNAFRFVDNDFLHLDDFGIAVVGVGSRIEEVSGNLFEDISTTRMNENYYLGVGLLLQGRGGETVPRLVRARGNRFVGNDAAVFLGGASELLESQSVDFGTSGDPGANVFRCNSRPTGDSMVGGDIIVSSDSAASTTLSFAGNGWDHVPPTSSTSDARSNGTDIAVLSPNVKPTIDASNATIDATACPISAVP